MGNEEILEEKSEKYFKDLTTNSNDITKSFETIMKKNKTPLNSQEKLIKHSSSEVILKTSIIMDYYF